MPKYSIMNNYGFYFVIKMFVKAVSRVMVPWYCLTCLKLSHVSNPIFYLKLSRVTVVIVVLQKCNSGVTELLQL